MTASQVIAFSGFAFPANQTNYAPLAASITTASATESEHKTPVREAGVFDKFGVRVYGNSVTATSTVKLRKSGADGSLSISVSSSSTGYFEDTSNSDTFANTDTGNFSVATGATGTSLSISMFALRFTPTDTSKCISFQTGQNPQSTSASNTQRYAAPAGIHRINATSELTELKGRIRSSQTARNYFVIVSANARSNATTCSTRVNGGSGAQSVSVGAGATGLFEDTSHSDSLVAGDDFDYSYKHGSGSGTQTTVMQGCTFENSAGQFEMLAMDSTGSTHNFNETRTQPPQGRAFPATPTTRGQYVPEFSHNFKELRVYVLTNTIATSASTYTVYVNDVQGNCTVSIPAGSTGLFSDTSSTDTVSVGNPVDVRGVTPNTSGALSISMVALLGTPAGQALVEIINETEAMTEALNKVLGFIKAVNETESVAEAINRLGGLIRTINETENITEALNKVLGFVKVINETENISEAINRIVGLIRAINETENITEALNYVKGVVKVINETEEISEALNRILGLIKNINETENISEALNRLGGLIRVINETENISEALNRIGGLIRNINEGEDISEALNRLGGLNRVVNETENITEAVNIIRGLIKAVNETENISEAINKVAGFVRVVNETSNIAEVLNKVLGFVKVINETEQVIEAVNRLLGIVRSVNETEEPSEWNIPQNGLVAYWPLDGDLIDRSPAKTDPFANDLDFRNSTIVAGYSGNARHFDGSTTYGVVKDYISLAGAFSVAIRFKRQGGGNGGTLGFNSFTGYSSEAAGAGSKIGLFPNTNSTNPNKFMIRIAANGSSSVVDLGYTDTLNDAWNFFVVTRSSSNVIKMSLNGAARVTGATISGTHNIGWVGRNIDAQYWLGDIDEILIYDRELSDTECSDLNSGTPVTANLLSQWKLNESSGTIAADEIPKSRDNTLVASGSPTLISGKKGQAYNYQNLQTHRGTYPPHAFSHSLQGSYCFWFRASVIPTVNVQVFQPNTSRMDCNVEATTGKMFCWFTDENNVGRSVGKTSVNICDNVWHFFVLIKDSTTAYFYMDGQLVGSFNSTLKTWTGVANTQIGNPGSAGLDCDFDEVMIYNRALSLDEMTMIYNQGLNQTVQKQVGLIRATNESEQISEALNRLSGLARVANESQQIVETINRLKAMTQNVNESQQVLEQINRLAGLVRVVNESTSIAEFVNKLVVVFVPYTVEIAEKLAVLFEKNFAIKAASDYAPVAYMPLKDYSVMLKGKDKTDISTSEKDYSVK